MELLRFLKLSEEEKSDTLWKKGLIIDLYRDKNKLIFLFYIFNYFVEVSINTEDDKIVDIIPYKRGFKLPDTGAGKRGQQKARL